MRTFLTAAVVLLCASQVNGQFECPVGTTGPNGHTVRIVDGYIQLDGTYNQLAGIEATSIAGLLSLDFIDVPDVGRVDLKTPFPSTASVVANTPNLVVIGVLGADNRIDISGETITAIGYSGDATTARSDLVVNVGLGDESPGKLFCPEPTGSSIMVLGVLGVLAVRRRK